MAYPIFFAQWCNSMARRLGAFGQGLRKVRQIALFTPVMACALACSGPLAILPGGQISGQRVEAEAVPTDWSVVGDYGFMEFETRPSDPYSVNIAYTVVGGALYAYAGPTETQWVKNMEDDPRVVVGIDGNLYPLQATRVTRPDEMKRFAVAWTSQNAFHRDPKNSDEVWLYRLGRR